jgi:hypothetical protein
MRKIAISAIHALWCANRANAPLHLVAASEVLAEIGYLSLFIALF